MHELWGVRACNYDNISWKHVLLGESTPKKFDKRIKIYHILHGITFWTIWIEQNDRVFSLEQWHESK